MDGWVFLGWYYEHEGRRRGPFSNQEIGRLLASGQLHFWDRVWKAWQAGTEIRFYSSEAGVAVGKGLYHRTPERALRVFS